MGIKDHGGWTELHQTSKYGHIEHAELFIRYGVDINTQNLVGNTPLHVACSHAQVRVVGGGGGGGEEGGWMLHECGQSYSSSKM